MCSSSGLLFFPLWYDALPLSEEQNLGLPWWFNDKNLPSNAGGLPGLTLSWGVNIPYAMRQLKPHFN